MDNASLPAGASMYYYCETLRRPRGHEARRLVAGPAAASTAPTCKDHINDGIISSDDTFADWLATNDKPRYRSDSGPGVPPLVA